MKLSIIIICYGHGEYLEGCLRSIPTGVKGLNGEYEVIVMNNGPKFTLSPLGTAEYPHTIVHHCLDRPLHRSWNRGCRLATGQYIAVCNDDLVFGYRSLTNCVEAMDRAKAHACYPCHTRHALPSDFDHLARNKSSEPGEFQGPPEFRGFCFLISAVAYEKVGPFDEEFQFYCGDDDYWFRLCKAGFWPREVRNALVHHYQEATTHKRMRDPEEGQAYRDWLNKALNQDLHRKYKKWGRDSSQVIEKIRRGEI